MRLYLKVELFMGITLLLVAAAFGLVSGSIKREVAGWIALVGCWLLLVVGACKVLDMCTRGEER